MSKAKSKEEVAFEKNPAFFGANYSEYRLLSAHFYLQLLRAVNPKSAPAFYLMRGVVVNNSNFVDMPVKLPLQPDIIQKHTAQKDYIKKLAQADSKALKAYQEEYKKLADENKLKDPYPELVSHTMLAKGVAQHDWEFLQEYFGHIHYFRQKNIKYQSRDVVSNLKKFSESVGLDDNDQKVLALLMAISNDPLFAACLNVVNDAEAMYDIYARAAGVTKKAFKDSLHVRGKLFRKGLVYASDEGVLLPVISPTVEMVLEGACSEEGYIKQIMGEARITELTTDDYTHLEKDIDLVSKMINHAHETGKKGVNILLWGNTGVGKTTLASVIAQGVGCKLYMPREKDDDTHQAYGRQQRFASLNIAQALFEGRKDVVVAFDEMEDLLLNQEEEGANGKAYFNHMMEENPVPVIWTVNDIRKFDPALLRRFTHNIHVKLPPANIRAGMYEKIAKRLGREISSEDAAKMGNRYIVSPGYIQKAMEADRACNPDKTVDINNLIHSIENSAVLSTGSRRGFSAPHVKQTSYDYGLANVTVQNMPFTLDQLLGKVKGVSQNVSFVLCGPAETGKTTLARQLANDITGRETIEYTLGDLLQGNMQQNLAYVFDEAQTGNNALLIKEAGGLVAYHSPSYKPTNRTILSEVLHNVKQTGVPLFVTATTDAAADPAALQHFTFSLHVDHLRPEQIQKCYETFFGRDLPPKSPLLESKLSTGDFVRTANIYNAFQKNISDQDIEIIMKDATHHRSGVGFRNHVKRPEH